MIDQPCKGRPAIGFAEKPRKRGCGRSPFSSPWQNSESSCCTAESRGEKHVPEVRATFLPRAVRRGAGELIHSLARNIAGMVTAVPEASSCLRCC